MRIVSGHPSCDVLLAVHQAIHPRQKGQRTEAETQIRDDSDKTTKPHIHAVNGFAASVPTETAVARQARVRAMTPKPR